MMPSALGLVHDSTITLEAKCGPKKLDGDANGLKRALLTKALPNTASIDEVVEQLKVNGGVIIKQAVALEDLDIIESTTLPLSAVITSFLTRRIEDLRPFLDNDKAWDGDFFPRETRRCMGLLGKSSTCAEKVIMHPLYQAACEKFLTTKNWFWSGHEKISAESKPQIMNTVAFSIGPGAKAQGLHRDDWAHHVVATEVESYPEDLQRDAGVGFFVAAKKATIENGATRYIPGSHLWDHSQEPIDELCEYAVMEPGDAFIMFASCYHGGGKRFQNS
jgi:ectoine hydroxylase-related dioxygenase (phytanoyl-CoA dioxygenase family)